METSPKLLRVIQSHGAPKEVSCQNCQAACCTKGTHIPLLRKEAAFLRAAGTELSAYEVPKQFFIKRVGHAAMRTFGYEHTEEPVMYLFESACGNLVEGPSGQLLCAAYESDERPIICERFLEGSYNCRWIRAELGIDTAKNLHIMTR